MTARTLLHRAARRYAGAGRVAERSARGKLSLDPVYSALLDRGVAEASAVVDLGCGRGLALAAILEARGGVAAPGSLVGIERRSREVRLARAALGEAATIVEADLVAATIPPTAAVLMIDVLHYLDEATQDALLDRACAALRPGGRVFLRDADASAGWRFRAVRLSERIMALGRGEGFRPFRYRTAAGWDEALTSRGLAVERAPCAGASPFANVLLVGRSPA